MCWQNNKKQERTDAENTENAGYGNETRRKLQI